MTGSPALGVKALTPTGLLRDLEAALRSGDDEGAARILARGRQAFPAHPAFAELAPRLPAGPDALLEAAGWTRPWHLARIPRKAHFYWGSERTSFLRYLSIASFLLQNPDWEVNLYLPTRLHRGTAAWLEGEAYEGASFQGRDYSDRLYQLPGLRLREVDFSAFPDLEAAPETYKSDFFRWHILSEEGGVYSDADILFSKPMREAPLNAPEHAGLDAALCHFRGEHIIGFFLAAPGTPLFRRVAAEAAKAFDPSDYQSLGSRLLGLLYPDLEAIRAAHPGIEILNLPMALVYPYDFQALGALHAPGDPDALPPDCLGVHWFGGSPLTQRYTHLIDHETCGHVGTLLDALASRLMRRLGPPPPRAAAPGAPGEADRERSPRFSVLVPSYNQAHFLTAALDSLQAQTFGDWEAVVVNDGSTDGTRGVLEAYAARDPRIRPFHQANGGVGSALNAALGQARGAWICWLSSDDLFEPDALETYARAMEELPTARFFYSNFSQRFEETGEKRPMPERRQLSLPDFGVQTLGLLEANYINGITICIERSLLQAAGGWRPELRHAQDLDLWLRLSAQTRLHYLDHRTAVTRVHPGQDSRSFPMAGFLDSARAVHDFLNTHRFEEIFPWVDLRSLTEISTIHNAVYDVVRNPGAFLYCGVGPNTVLLDRLAEWVHERCPSKYRLPVLNMWKETLAGAAPGSLAPSLRAWGQGLGPEPGPAFQPVDPLVRMEAFLRTLEAGGEATFSKELRRYLVQLAGRDLREPEAPSPTPHAEGLAPAVRAGFLLEPDWDGAAWEGVLRAYLEAFAPGEAVLLVLALDPERPGQLPLEEAQRRVLETVQETGRATFPDVALVDTPGDLAEVIRDCASLQWLEARPEVPWALVGPAGEALVAARTRLLGTPTPGGPAGPAVSVILPTRNRPHLLARALRSLQAQTFRDFEVLVVDDGGVHVGAVLREFEAAGLPLHVLAHPFQRGQAAARNTALAQARGAWIAYLDDDDCYEPDHLEGLLEAARKVDGAVIHADATRFREDASGRILSRSRVQTTLADPRRMGEEDTIPLGCILHRREGAPAFDASLLVLEDLDFLRRLAERCPFRHVPKATLQIHEREGDPGASRRREPLRALSRERLHSKGAAAPPASTPSGGDHGPL